MLEKLVVDNYLLIDHIEFDGYDGVSVFVGETGSGKSLFIESLGIILGNKFSLSNIGTFRDITTMSAVFSIPESSTQIQAWFEEHDFLYHDEIIITRLFQRSGKSTTRLNGEIIPVQVIRQLGEMLVDIHSQFDTQRLLKSTVQQAVIDDRIDVDITTAYREAFSAYKEAIKQYEQFEMAQQSQFDLDYLYFQRDELLAYQSYTKESVRQLEGEYKQLKHDVENHQYVEMSTALLGDDGIRSILTQLHKQLQYIDNEKNQFLQLYNDVVQQVDELDYRLSQQSVDEDATLKFQQLEQELQAIYRLQQKHGEDLAEAYQQILEQIEHVEDADTRRLKLQDQMTQKEEKARRIAKQLDKERDIIIQHVEEQITTYLNKLHLSNIQFRIIREDKSELMISGVSTIQFQVASNNQTTFQPLAKVVSGGELSRIMLALKVVMLEGSHLLMVFDEIDSGVSGKVAASIADVLHQLAEQHQVFLITHSPLVAVSGKQFYEISKQIREDKQYETRIEQVNTASVNYLLAHLISQQSPSDAAIQQIQYLREKYE